MTYTQVGNKLFRDGEQVQAKPLSDGSWEVRGGKMDPEDGAGYTTDNVKPSSVDFGSLNADGSPKSGAVPKLQDVIDYFNWDYSTKSGYSGQELSFADPAFQNNAGPLFQGYKGMVDAYNKANGKSIPYEINSPAELAKFDASSVGEQNNKGSNSLLGGAVQTAATIAAIYFGGQGIMNLLGPETTGSLAAIGGETGSFASNVAANAAADVFSPTFAAGDVLGNTAVNAATGLGFGAGTEAGLGAGASGLGGAFDSVGNTVLSNGVTLTGPELPLPSNATPGLDTVNPMADQAPAPVKNGPTNPGTLEKALTQAGMDPANAAKVAQAASTNSLPPGSSSLLSRVLSGNATAGDISGLVSAAKSIAGLVSSASGSGNVQAGTTAADTAANIALDQWNYYKQNYQPLETNLINQANTAGSPDEFARARGTANADVTGAFDKAGKQTASRLQSFGINPGAPAYQAAMGSTDLAQGAATAGALTTADNNTRDRAFSKALDVASIGKGIPASATAGLNSASAAKNNAAVTANNLNSQTQRNIGYGLDNLGNLVGKAATWFGGTSDPVKTYGSSNVFSPDGSTGSLSTGINWDDEYADGGRVGIDPMDPRSQSAFERATGDDINAKKSTRAAAQPVSEGQTSLTREERNARNAKSAAGPSDPKMRAQMGLPPLKGFARGGHVGLDSVLAKRGLSDDMRRKVITPHMRFADGGSVDEPMGLDDSMQASETSQPLQGAGDGTSDSIPAEIDGQQPAALSDGEFVVNEAAVNLSGSEMLEAINNAGLKKRQQVGLDSAQPQQPKPPMTSNQLPTNAGMQAYRGGGRVRHSSYWIGA